MKKFFALAIMLVLLATFMLFWCACGYFPKTHTYQYTTELGDVLNVEVTLAHTLSETRLTYRIKCVECDGQIYTVDESNGFYYDFPNDSISRIKAAGRYDVFNFYEIKHQDFTVMFYVYDGKHIYVLNSTIYSNGVDSTEDSEKKLNAKAIETLMKTDQFRYILTYGEVLASYKDETMYERLCRYANNDFTSNELNVNLNSQVAPESITNWANDLLKKYYSQ